jgi:hypothetical protein
VIEYVVAKHEHVEPIAAKMRQSDIDEITASTGNSPFTALSIGAAESQLCWTMLKDGEPVMMFGCKYAPELAGDIAVIWMLATDEAEQCKKALTIDAVRYVDIMHCHYPRLFNLVDARNKKTIRWLEWLGFEMLPPIIYGKAEIPFHPFLKEKYNV